jgi:hypothetical protein
LLISFAAEAAQPGKYNLLGTGNSSCGSWTAWRRERRPEAWFAEQWILGFLSGVGYVRGVYGRNPLNGVDADAVWTWMDIHCQANPLDTIEASTAAFATIHPN